MGWGALPEHERLPAWVAWPPHSHTHSHSLPCSHTCARTLTIHRASSRPSHTHALAVARTRARSRSPVPSDMRLAHAHSCSCSAFTHSAGAHVFSFPTRPTRAYSEAPPTRAPTCSCVPHPHEPALSRHAHSCSGVLGSPPTAKFTPRLPQRRVVQSPLPLNAGGSVQGDGISPVLRSHSSQLTCLPSVRTFCGSLWPAALVWSASSVFSGSPSPTSIQPRLPLLPPYSNPSLEPLLGPSPHCAGLSCPLHQEPNVCRVQVMPSLHTTPSSPALLTGGASQVPYLRGSSRAPLPAIFAPGCPVSICWNEFRCG